MDTIGFIGVGNMGSAILKGIAGSSLKQETSLFAYNPTEAKVDALANCGVQKCGSAAEVVEKSQYVFLAIKPQKFEEVLPQIADAVTEETVLVSIAAGIGADFIRKMTKPYAKVVLAMPNTPLLLGEGATALAKDDAVSDAEFAVVQRIFGSCGMTAVIAPEQMKEVIAINGFHLSVCEKLSGLCRKSGSPGDIGKGTVCTVADRFCKDDYGLRLFDRRTDPPGLFAGRNDACRSGSAVRGQAV